jgi:copper chaperone CopZ
MPAITYTVPAISCGHCVHTIETELADLPGVIEVEANMDTKKVKVVFDAPANDEKIKALLAEINYPAES